jgi:hypothetical protein
MKKIIGLMKKYSFFILWANDILIYEEKIEFYQRKATFNIYVFTSELFTQKFIFELTKRCNETFKQDYDT